MLFSGIIEGFCPFFRGFSPSVQSTFSLLQRSLAATTLHKPQVPEATPSTHAPNDPKALNRSRVHCLHRVRGDHKPSPRFALPQPALVFQHLLYWYACSRMGSASPVHKLFPFVTLADSHETTPEVTVIEYSVVSNKGLSGQR